MQVSLFEAAAAAPWQAEYTGQTYSLQSGFCTVLQAGLFCPSTVVIVVEEMVVCWRFYS